MATLLGLDLGTSTAKALLLDDQGHVRAAASRSYPILAPRPGWAEQEPAAWWEAVCGAVQELRRQAGGAALLADLRGIGLSGQMHGTVALDGAGHPLRPAIIWADGRAADDAAALTAAFRARRLTSRLGGTVAPGFMAATLAWLRVHEPETWAAMASCVLPKDALRQRLTGGPPLTDASDASATPLLDLERRAWSPEAQELLGLAPGVLPPVREAADVVGTVHAGAAAALGVPLGTPVLVGGSDQGMAAVGAGVMDAGDVLISVSTGGQVVAPLTSPTVDDALRAHTLCHVVPGHFLVLAATLSAGLALRWVRESVFGGPEDQAFAALLEGAAAVTPGAGGLIFLPYLLGERSPHLAPTARALFAGVALQHGQPHLLRAVLEGVAYSLRDALGVLEAVGVQPSRIIAAGGGMRMPLWRQILADVLGRPLLPLAGSDQSALGAALVAGTAVGLFSDLASACRLAVRHDPLVEPNASTREVYERGYATYGALYPAVARATEADGPPTGRGHQPQARGGQA